jgi:hypothetical protein
LPGTYDVGLSANQELCWGAQPSPVPCVGGALKTSVALKSDGVLDVDMQMVRLSGSVTLNGATIPDAPQHRGALEFSQRGSTDLTARGSSKNFRSTFPVRYDMALLAGKYVINHDANESLCERGGAAPSVPCAPQVLRGCP